MHMSSTGNFVTGLFIGLAAGSVIALLSTPKTGAETRHVIYEKTNELKDMANDTIDDVLSQTEVAVNQAKQFTTETIDRARDRINKLQTQGNKIMDAQKKRLDRLNQDYSEVSPQM
jgi:gas vesicle protein